MIKKKRKKPKIVKKERIYKYYVDTLYEGGLQKVLVEAEGKKEVVMVSRSPLINAPISKRLLKKSDEGVLCDTFEEAKKEMMKYKTKRIKYHKQKIEELEADRKRFKVMKEDDCKDKYAHF